MLADNRDAAYIRVLTAHLKHVLQLREFNSQLQPFDPFGSRPSQLLQLQLLSLLHYCQAHALWEHLARSMLDSSSTHSYPPTYHSVHSGHEKRQQFLDWTWSEAFFFHVIFVSDFSKSK
jgi:hypothetical protein